MDVPAETFCDAVRPLVEAVGAELVALVDAGDGDLTLRLDGEPVVAVRLPDLHGALDRIVAGVERELGGRLADLSREDKQVAVALLDDRGAFNLRKAVEQIADVLEVSRFTVYNYLNARHR